MRTSNSGSWLGIRKKTTLSISAHLNPAKELWHLCRIWTPTYRLGAEHGSNSEVMWLSSKNHKIKSNTLSSKNKIVKLDQTYVKSPFRDRLVLMSNKTWKYINIYGSRDVGEVKGLVAQLCPTLWTIAHQTPVRGILQARILEWVAMPFSRASSLPRDRTRVSWIAGRFSTRRESINQKRGQSEIDKREDRNQNKLRQGQSPYWPEAVSYSPQA